MDKISKCLLLFIIVTSYVWVYPVNAQLSTSLPVFDQEKYYQGDSGSLQVSIYNDHDAFQITTKQCYLQFDWQESQNQAFVSPDKPIIASRQSYSFTFSFSIPTNIEVGSHKYKVVWVDQGFLLGSVTVESGYLTIRDAYEKVYQSAYSAVIDKYNQYLSYSSTGAKTYVQQAYSSISLATQLAQQGQWRDAVDKLNSANNLLDQADGAETLNKQQIQQQQSQEQNMIYILIVVALIIIIGVLVYRRTRK